MKVSERKPVEPLALTLDEAADAIRISIEKLRQLIERNEIERIYIDAKPVVEMDELRRFLKSRPNERGELAS